MIRRIFPLKFKPQEWLLVLFCIASYPVSLHLPPSWGWEDGPIENTQVAVLQAGCAWAAFISLRSRHAPLAALARFFGQSTVLPLNQAAAGFSQPE